MSCIIKDPSKTKQVNAVQLVQFFNNAPKTPAIITYDPSQAPNAFTIQALNDKIISQSVIKGVAIGAGSMLVLVLLIVLIKRLVQKK